MSAAPAVPLDREHALALMREMLRIRVFEDRCYQLYGQMKIRGFLHLYNGEEAVAVGALQALGDSDAIVATYREHGHAIARGIPMTRLMAELFGKQSGCSRGRGGSMHLFDAERRFFGGNAIVAGGLPIAVGLALAAKLQARTDVTVCFFSDGAVAEGEFHESLNLASLWTLPVLFICENNLYAMGTALQRAQAETDVTAKAGAYRIEARAVDGMDVLAVESTVRDAVAKMRRDGAPALLEMRTYRFRAHSMFDPQLYRDKAEIDAWQKRGPIVTLSTRLRASGLMSEDDYQRLERDALTEVDAAVQFAESAPWEAVSDLERYVYAERTA